MVFVSVSLSNEGFFYSRDRVFFVEKKGIKRGSQTGKCAVTQVKSCFCTKQSFLISRNAFSLGQCITCTIANFLGRNYIKVLRTFLEHNNYTLAELSCGYSYSAVKRYE